MLVEHGLAGVVAIEGVQRGGAELQPQHDEAGAAEAAQQADPLMGSLPGIRRARRAGVRHGDLPRTEQRLLLSILAVAGAKVVVPGEAPERAGTQRAYSAGSTR